MFQMTPSLDEMARVAQGIPSFGPLPSMDEIHQEMTLMPMPGMDKLFGDREFKKMHEDMQFE